MTASDLTDILEHQGPRTGAELIEATRLQPLPLWRLCRHCDAILWRRIGRRFLRLDRAVEGYARLSPSVRREFLTYTVLGLANQPAAIDDRAGQLRAEIERISRFKSNLARETMASVLSEMRSPEALTKVAFIIAGDITYGMSHTVPRPEPSTGSLVRGSDLDIIAVASDDCSDATLEELDDAIYRKKHFLLVHPDHCEEIDYVIKRIERVRAQLKFDTFEHMVASKILLEGQMLCGNSAVFDTVKRLVAELGVPEKVADLEMRAAKDREHAEEYLLSTSDDNRTGEHFNLFYTREERDEIY